MRNPPAHSGMPVKLSIIPSVSKLPLGGRRAHFYQNWQNITNDPWVLETVVGYKIEFLKSPHQTYIPSMHASEEERDLIDQEVLFLHQKHAIHKVLKPNGHDPSQFISPLFTVPKKGGGHRPVINLKDLNQFVEYQHFKMEGVPMLKDLLRPNYFLTKIELKDAYLTVPTWIHHQKFLRFIWRDTVGVRMSSLRASQCTPHVRKVTKTSCSPVKKNGNQTNYLPRRHAYHGRVQRLSHRTHHHYSQPVIQPRFCVKRGKVYSSTYSRIGVPWLSGEFSKNVFVPPKGQSKEYQKGVSESVKQPLRVYQNTVSTSGETVLFNPSSIPSTPALQVSFDGQNNGSEENLKLRINTPPEPGSSRRAPVVERSPCCLERQIPLEKEGRSVDRDGCFQPRLGCMLQWGKNRRNLVSSRTPSTHKLLGINGRRFCNKIILQEQSLNPSKIVDGQYHCHSVHQQNGGLIPSHHPSQPSLRDLAVVPPKRDLSHSTPYPWHLQQCSRSGIQSGSRFIRLETGPISFCSPERAVGSIRGRSVRDTANKSATQVRELETGSRGGSDRRFLSGLVSAKGLHIPPL